MVHGAVPLGLNVSRTTGEHKSIQRRNEAVPFDLILQGKHHPFGTRPFDRPAVIFGFAWLAGASSLILFRTGTPRDADAGPPRRARGGVDEGHRTLNRSIRTEVRQP